jgi:hypothetical protein
MNHRVLLPVLLLQLGPPQLAQVPIALEQLELELQRVGESEQQVLQQELRWRFQLMLGEHPLQQLNQLAHQLQESFQILVKGFLYQLCR